MTEFRTGRNHGKYRFMTVRQKVAARKIYNDVTGK